MAAAGAHPEGVPGFVDAGAGVVAQHHEVGDVGWAARGRVQPREHGHVPEFGRERDERLAPVQHPAALDGGGGGVGDAAARGAPQPLLGGGGVHEAAILDRAPAELVEPLRRVAVALALGSEADEMHVEGERGGAVTRGERLLHTHELGERKLVAAVRTGHGELQETGLAEVGEILVGEGALAVVAGGALGEALGQRGGKGEPIALGHRPQSSGSPDGGEPDVAILHFLA